MIYTARWALNGTPIPGPDAVVYTEMAASLRMDGVPIRQGMLAMDWQYQSMLIDDYALILAAWTYPVCTVVWLDAMGSWQTSDWCVAKPHIGKRSGFHAQDVVMRFTPIVYTGAGMSIAHGSEPTLYGGFDVANPPPVARIAYTAAIVGDPEVVVNLDGSGSTDADGVIVAYTWTDNAAAFQALTDYPAFTSPHETTGAMTTFVYPFSKAMPNPVVTLVVTDNAGQEGSTQVTVDIATLVAALPTKGIRMLVVAGGTAYVSYDGGLEFQPITDVANVTCAAGAGGYIVLGTESGAIYVTLNDSLVGARDVCTMPTAVKKIAVSPQATSSVAAIDSDGNVVYSSSSGQFWSSIGNPTTVGTHVAWNSDVANDLGVGGLSVLHTRNAGVIWEHEAGLVDGAWTTQRSLWLRYAGGAGLYAATGDAWVAIDDTLAVTALSPIGGTDKNRIIVGLADGTLIRVVETEKQVTQTVGSRINDLARHGDSLILIGTNAGLYKSLDDLASVGLMMFPGLTVPSVDFLRDSGAGNGEIVLPVIGDVDVAGIWHHIYNVGWTRKNGTGDSALPVGFDWFHVVADPYDRAKWAALGNTPGHGRNFDHRNGEVVCTGMDVSPLWVTTDSGLTWNPVRLFADSHVGHVLDDAGGFMEWNGFTLDDMEFDRVATRKLFVFGHGAFAANDKYIQGHGLVWHGAGMDLRARWLANGTASWNNTGFSVYYTNDVMHFSSFAGGPDGSVVGYSISPGGFFNTEYVVRLIYTDTAITKVYKNPGGIELTSGRGNGISGISERRPLFNSFAMVGLVRLDGTSTCTLYGTQNYRTAPIAQKVTLERPGNVWGGVSFTYAVDGIYVGGGMGVVHFEDVLTTSTQETYENAIHFSVVRTDRQWRKIVAAMAYTDARIHIKTDKGWGLLALPDGVAAHTGEGMEVLGL